MSDAKKTQSTPARRAGGRKNAAANKRGNSPASNASGSSGSHGGISEASAAAATVPAGGFQNTGAGAGASHSSRRGGANIAEELQFRLAEVERREREIARWEARQAQSTSTGQEAIFPEKHNLAVRAGPGAEENAVTAAVREEVRIAAVQPPELTYVSASKGSALEDWLFKLEQLFAQTRKTEAEWQERVRIAKLHWDRHMFLWWSGCEKAASESGAPIASWTAFVSALRRQFVPAGDAEAARLELFRLRMGGGESMDTYVQRAVLLVARAGGFIDDKMAGALLMEGADASRFPFTVQSVRRRLHEAGMGGLSFAQVRAELSMEAHSEPNLLPAARGVNSAPAAAGGNYRSNKSGSAGGASSKQVRINALRKQLHALETAGEEGEDSPAEGPSKVQVAPVGAGAKGGGSHRKPNGVACYKCGVEGHVVAECTSKKELRKCYLCEEVGHVRTHCPRKKRQEGAAAASAEIPSKNE